MGDLQSPALPLGYGAVRLERLEGSPSVSPPQGDPIAPRSVSRIRIGVPPVYSTPISVPLRWNAVIGAALLVFAVAVPAGVTATSWRLFAIFIATIVGSIVRPVPASAVIFLGITAVALTGTLPPADVLAGYADSLV